MKKILGLCLGTNSIGWALIQQDEKAKAGKILGAGTRILPTSQDILGKFNFGQSISHTADRTRFRGIRRLRERHLLRRERLHRVLNILGFLPGHYAGQIDFDKHPGQFMPGTEPKLCYVEKKNNGKADFLFKSSFAEMLNEFAKYQPDLLKDDKKIPYAWTIYYLRKKALTQKIEKEELAWLLLNFNQKRGYYQLRGEEEEQMPDRKAQFLVSEVIDVTAGEQQKDKEEIWYNIVLQNGWIYRRPSKTPLFDWIGKTKEFIVTEELNGDGTMATDKEGREKRSFKAVDAEKDWVAIKKSTEQKIEQSNKTVGHYIYDSLLANPAGKIRGKLVQVIERKFYKAELEQILKSQQQFHGELRDGNLYRACYDELYENNEAHRNNGSKKDFAHLFVNDIIFYQRPLKSQTSLTGNCKLEMRTFIRDGKKEIEPLKCIAKSHPLFQEFRLWQWLQNLKIFKKAQPEDIDVTDEFLKTQADWANLFGYLNTLKKVDHKTLLSYLLKPLKLKTNNYRWNYAYDAKKDESKSYPCNETRFQILSGLKKLNAISPDFLTKENEEELWHILYSVSDKIELEKALKTFSQRKGLGGDFVAVFGEFPPFKKEYGAYSAKAIKKLLPLMRMGKYWNEAPVASNIGHYRQNITKIILNLTNKNGANDQAVNDGERNTGLLEKFESLLEKDGYAYQGLPHFLASYIVYGRPSEDAGNRKWVTADQIGLLTQHSLGNPIVEQVINETLKVVKDIWINYGAGEANFFNEIHIGMGSEMKNPAEKRRQMTMQRLENESADLQIKASLIELLNDGQIENREKTQPNSAELLRYKLWVEQKHRSPYTGSFIPLNKLFTREYRIGHILPQSEYFDDSFNNKVICETAINAIKDRYLAMEFIKERAGEIVPLGPGKKAAIFTISGYADFVKNQYSSNRAKLNRLLMKEIPGSFIKRQQNDSGYISKVVKSLMSNMVREDGEQVAISKNVVVCKEAITAVLKQDWGLNDIWNEMVAPRFERLNVLTDSADFGDWIDKKGEKVFQTRMPIELQKGFDKKRIDHRHHALNAIVIACASRSHVNYLNNEAVLDKGPGAGKEKKRHDLKQMLCFKKFDSSMQNDHWIFRKPWGTFTLGASEELQTMLVSFKQNLRIINKAANYSDAWKKDGSGKLVKELIKQTKGDHWAIRKPMHKDTVSGLIQLKFEKTVSLSTAIDNWKAITYKPFRRHMKELTSRLDKKQILDLFKEKENRWNDLDVSLVEIYYWNDENAASRVKIDESFNSSKIESITDSGIRKIMMNHLEKYSEQKNEKIIEHPENAFSHDGLEELNKNMVTLNNGNFHQPIYKVRTYVSKGNKFAVGSLGNKKGKFVDTAIGTNLYFAVYQDISGKRSYRTVPLNIVIERQEQGLSAVPDQNDLGHQLLFYLSPNDLVYIPNEEEKENLTSIDFKSFRKEKINRIYKIVSFTGNRLSAVPFAVAKSIVDKVEFSKLNKSEFSLEKELIKDVCVKLLTDRLGTILKYIG